jgi:endonuclease/exonuclease/phosphatase family metal-dependent hydrolase
MVPLRILSLCLGLSFACSLTAQPPALTVMSYNIRYATDRDGENSWSQRKNWLADQVRFYGPTVLGIQEGLFTQVRFLDSSLVDYAYLGVGRDDGARGGEFSAVYYDTTRLELLRAGTFWLSPTPDRPSVGWDAALERICSYGRFRDRVSGTPFWVFNTHFDHVGVAARAESVRLILDRINTLNTSKDPVVLTGDLNLEPAAAPIRWLSERLADTREVATDLVFGPVGTFNGFQFDRAPTRRIDYVFVSPGVRVSRYAVLSDSQELRYPSDHLPVWAEIYLPE